MKPSDISCLVLLRNVDSIKKDIFVVVVDQSQMKVARKRALEISEGNLNIFFFEKYFLCVCV